MFFYKKGHVPAAAQRSGLWMENGQIHAAADLSVDLLIVVSEFFPMWVCLKIGYIPNEIAI